jgi:hypothetical protein
MPDLRADAMALLEIVSQPEEHTKPPTPQAQGSTQAPWPSESAAPVTAAPRVSCPGTTGTARAPAWDSRRSFYALYRFGRLRYELFDLSSGLRLQPRAQCR